MTFQDAAHAVQQSGDEVTWSAVSAWATAKVIQWGKAKQWIPLLSTETGAETANRLVAWAAALLMSLGVAVTFDGTTGQFALTGSVAGVMSGLAHMVRQVMLQEIAYKKFIKP